MSTGLVAPAIILTFVFLGSTVVLFLDSRERKLTQQLALAVEFGTNDTVPLPTRSIRRKRTHYQRLREIMRNVFRYDPDIRVAYKAMPIPIVLTFGALAGISAGLFASISLPSRLCVLVGFAVAGMTIRGLFGRMRDRYTNSLLKQMPDTLVFVVSAVRSGIPVAEAFHGVTREIPEPTRAQFVEVMNEVALGRPIHAALLNLYYRTRVTEFAIFAVALAVQTRSGGQLADTIQMLAETVRERITIVARASALAGEAKVSAIILSALPVVVGLLLTVINPGYLDPLFHEPAGKRLFLIGVTMLLIGILTMRRMIARAVGE
jgi:tight adherence protein B